MSAGAKSGIYIMQVSQAGCRDKCPYFVSGIAGAHRKILMALKSIRPILSLSLLFILLSSLILTKTVQALSSRDRSDRSPLLETFTGYLANSQAAEVRRIYIPELSAAPVVQQPRGMDEFISSRQGIITQFGLASQFGSTGLLAHNYLAGEDFFRLEEGQRFDLIYEDGSRSTFVVTEILSYQALEPTSTRSDFLDLGNGRVSKASELFLEIYDRPGQVILQTCISAQGNPSWGRLFVIASPYSQKP